MLFKREREEPRTDANLNRITVSGGVAGLIVTLVMLAIFLAGLPPARWFLAAAVPVGIIVAIILHFTARDR